MVWPMTPQFSKRADGFGPQPIDGATPTPKPMAPKPTPSFTPPATGGMRMDGGGRAGTITSQGSGIAGGGGGWGIGTVMR